MSPFELLFELEFLSHAGRQRRIALLGRDPQNAALFDELERGATSYERRLAIQSCCTSRDGERVLRMLGDSSRLVRGTALGLVPVACGDEQVARAFVELKPKTVRALVKRLKKRGRQSAIDALLQSRFAQGDDASLEELLPFASPQVAEPILEAQFESASVQDFARLTRLQPALALRHALELSRALSSPDGVVLAKANAVLTSAASFRIPEERSMALELVRELNRQFPLARLELSALLLSGSAQPLAELVLESGETVNLAWSSRAARIGIETLVALIRAQNGAIGNWARVLKRLPFGTRATLWREFGVGLRSPIGAVDTNIVALLPRELRQLEARRNFDLPDIQATPASWLVYVWLLPFEEAWERAKPFIGDPDPDFRGAALKALISNARFERAQIGAVLNLVQARRNEGDPVRGAMLGALAALPPSIFEEKHLPALAIIQRQALDARDLSYGTAAYLSTLVVALLPRFPAWSATQLAELLKERGHVSFFDLQSRINDSQLREIGPTLEPVFASWAAREHAPFLGAMRAFGKRLKVWDAGAALLTNFLNNGPNSQLVAAAQILSDFRRDVWEEVVPQLLEKDESWALQPVVYNFLHTHRTDLLSPAILGRSKLKGKFKSGRTRDVLPFEHGFERWTPSQQELFALTLGEVLADTSRESPGAFFVINRLCELPDIAPTSLLEQAQLSNPNAAWREAALRVLSRLDGGQGVETLLESLDDERARIAIYGLRRTLLEMPDARALDILREVPMQKVTVAKEVVRLLGELKTPDAFEFLLELSGRELHRDVRVALLRGLWHHLENPRVWPLLEEAGQSPDPAIATMAARTTAPRMSLQTRVRLNAMLSTLLAHPDARVRLQVLGNGAIGAISDPQMQLLEALLRCLDSKISTEYSTATRAIWGTYAGTSPDAIALATSRLLPRRRALGEVLTLATYQIAFSPAHFAVPARAVLDVLAQDENALLWRLKFALTALEPLEFAALVEEVEAQGRLHFGALSSLINDLGATNMRFKGETLGLWSGRWLRSDSSSLRRLALAVVVRQAREASGWTDDLRASLLELRADSSPLVSSAAQFTFWPGEEE